MRVTAKIFSLAVLSLGLLMSLASVELGPGDSRSPDVPNMKTGIIDSANGGCFYFADGRTSCPQEGDPDIRVEPWCTQNPGICANWVETSFTNLDDATEIPASGYTQENSEFSGCEEVTPNQVLFFKLADDSIAKAIISNDAYNETSSGCDHRITLDYVYPVQ